MRLFDTYGGPIRTLTVMEGKRNVKENKGVKENYGFVSFRKAVSAKNAFEKLQNFMFLDGSVLELILWEENNATRKREPRHRQFTNAEIGKASQPNIHQLDQAGRV